MEYKRSPRSYFIIRKGQALKNKTKQQNNKTTKQQNNKQIHRKNANNMLCNILSDELVGVVDMVVVIPVSRVPVMALTIKSPNFPFLTAS